MNREELWELAHNVAIFIGATAFFALVASIPILAFHQ